MISGTVLTVRHPLADHGIRCRFGWLGSDGWCHGELVSSGVRTRWLPRWVTESTVELMGGVTMIDRAYDEAQGAAIRPLWLAREMT